MATVNKDTFNKAVEVRVARIKASTKQASLQHGPLADWLEQQIHLKAYGPRDSGPMNSRSPALHIAVPYHQEPPS